MEFSLIFMMQIFSGIFGAWVGFFLTDRFFARMRQKEERAAQQKKFDADVIYIQNGLNDISAELAELEERFNNGPCGNGFCSTGNGKSFNCIEAYKELEVQIRELERAHNINPMQTPV
jgi:hypothetical protein